MFREMFVQTWLINNASNNCKHIIILRTSDLWTELNTCSFPLTLYGRHSYWALSVIVMNSALTSTLRMLIHHTDARGLILPQMLGMMHQFSAAELLPALRLVHHDDTYCFKAT